MMQFEITNFRLTVPGWVVWVIIVLLLIKALTDITLSIQRYRLYRLKKKAEGLSSEPPTSKQANPRGGK